jgi:oxygen-independent coproporphyrinogen-3 oxidase
MSPVQQAISLAEKYNRPVPRYTSYPTVPYWRDAPDIPRWEEAFQNRFQECNHSDGISLYVHLPFCESLCIYCGCNKKITSNHSVERGYIDAVLKEWGHYLRLMGEAPLIREIHFGGGTPTFFSPFELRRLVTGLTEVANIHPDYAFSIEGHPNNTSYQHLETLANLGFRRISYGVQDLNPDVQRAIRRIQPFENLERATVQARAAGFESVNFDLVYGLPLQSQEFLRQTIGQALTLRPDRIAFYSYAHTPWLNASQGLIDEKTLPSAEEKLRLYGLGKELLEAGGYTNIGMDHFALPEEELYKAWKEGRLHRDFMGYTPRKSGLILGLGVSAISETGTAFAQNEKSLAGYYRRIKGGGSAADLSGGPDGGSALQKNCFLNEEDRVFRRYILDIACKGFTNFDRAWAPALVKWTLPRLLELQADGLVSVNEYGVLLTDAGKPYLRHVCKAFDLRLLRDEEARQQDPKGDEGGGLHTYFSKAI